MRSRRLLPVRGIMQVARRKCQANAKRKRAYALFDGNLTGLSPRISSIKIDGINLGRSSQVQHKWGVKSLRSGAETRKRACAFDPRCTGPRPGRPRHGHCFLINLSLSLSLSLSPAGPTTTPLGAHAPRTFFDKLFSLHRHGPWAMRGGARKRGSNAQARLPCNYAHVSATTLTFRVANHAHA